MCLKFLVYFSYFLLLLFCCISNKLRNASLSTVGAILLFYPSFSYLSVFTFYARPLLKYKRADIADSPIGVLKVGGILFPYLELT